MGVSGGEDDGSHVFCLRLLQREEMRFLTFWEAKQGSKETQAEEAHVNVPAGG